MSELAVEPLLIFAIDTGGSFLYFSDSSKGPSGGGYIISANNIDSAANISAGDQSTSITITVSDVSLNVLNLFSTIDLHKKPAYLYQSFVGRDISEAKSVFQGELSSPITWNEGSRTVTFTVVSPIENSEFGFSPEEGDIVNLRPELIGVPWPVVVGTVIKSPTLRLNELPIGILKEDLGIADRSLSFEIVRIQGLIDQYSELSRFYLMGALGADEGDTGTQDSMTQVSDQLQTSIQEMQTDILKLMKVDSEQQEYERDVASVIGDFPSALVGDFDIGGATYTGSISGSSNGFAQLTIKSVVHPDAEEKQSPSLMEMVYGSASGSTKTDKGKFIYIAPGTQVRYMGDYEISYIISLFEIDIGSIEVYAWRQFNGLRTMMQVPKSYYRVSTLSEEGSGGYSSDAYWKDAQLVILRKPLSSYVGEDWEDELYVSMSSSKVKNTFTEFISFAVTLYTDLLPNFHVGVTQANLYPMHFTYMERKNILDFLKEVAWQQRCACWIKDGYIHFMNMAYQGPSVDSISEESILENSISVSFTSTEEIVTKARSLWRWDLSRDQKNEIIIRYNTQKYGIMEQTYDFYIFNTPQVVEKMTSFWLARYGNTWKKISFRTTLEHFDLDIYDVITLSLSTTIPYVSTSTSTVAMIESAVFDAAQNEMVFEAWVPIKSGESDKTDVFWPSSATLVGFPDEDHGGGVVRIKKANSESTPSILDNIINPSTPNMVTGEPEIIGLGSINGDKGTKILSDDDPATINQTLAIPHGEFSINTPNRPIWDYNYRDYDINPTDPLDKNVYPGQVISGSGRDYKINIFPQGLTKKGVAVKATLMQWEGQSPDDDVPPNTAILVCRTVYQKDDGELKPEYWFQVPVWQ